MRAVEIKYDDLITVDRLFQAWSEFKSDKTKKRDLQIFERHLEENLFSLFENLKSRIYKHGGYQAFKVHDPKERQIHKASVADRVIHHLLYNLLYETFDKSFIHDSYSCRNNKGTHKAILRLVSFTRKVSKNYTKPCFALKLDIRKFFASVDHEILMSLLDRKIGDVEILSLLKEVVGSFSIQPQKGIPLGNLTSQVFANIYLNELDQFVKHKLCVRYYIRYADDFLILSNNKNYLEELLPHIQEFVSNKLKLSLHPDKIVFRNFFFGIDFLGYIVFPHHILPRTKTKKRMFNKIYQKLEKYQNDELSFESLNQSLQSYLGYLSHADAYKLSEELKNQILFRG